MTNKLARMVYERWCSDLRNKDRSKNNLYNNFFELFADFKAQGIEIDEANEYLDKAVVYHYPSVSVAKSIYKSRPAAQKRATEQEFIAGWKQLIRDMGVQAFYDVYPLKKSEETPPQRQDDPVKDKLDGDPKLNGMSREEYLAQRRYAESFPLIDFSKVPDLYNDNDFETEDFKK